MRPPALIKRWLSEEELAVWVREAPSKDAYQKRLAVWLTHLRHSAADVADFLQVSKPAVWRWVGQYNRLGPEGLRRKGRGGRRWSFLSWEKEQALLQSWEERALGGEILTAPQLVPEIEEAVGNPVSVDYVYKLLHRHDWRKLGPRPRHVKAEREVQAEFKKTSQALSKKLPSKLHRG
jgi:transposase